MPYKTPTILSPTNSSPHLEMPSALNTIIDNGRFNPCNEMYIKNKRLTSEAGQFLFFFGLCVCVFFYCSEFKVVGDTLILNLESK